MGKTHFDIMVAMCDNRGIGNKRGLPWPPIKADYEYYNSITAKPEVQGKKCVAVQGRVTWECTGEKQKSRENVFNIVITKNPSESLRSDVHVHKILPSLQAAIDFVFKDEDGLFDRMWIFGGNIVYEEALRHPACRAVYVTHVFGDYQADTFFPEFEESFTEAEDKDVNGSMQEENGIKFQFKVYQRKSKLINT